MFGLPALPQEMLKDARTANADMDDDAMSSSRQAARLRHALEESQAALKAAQAALAQVQSAGDGGNSVGLPQTGAMKWGSPVC